jgi:MFS family permease
MVLRDSSFRRFLASDVISGFGVGLATIGANWYVLMETGESRYVGALLAVNVLAGFVASLVSGVITDRFNRKTVIFVVHITRAVFAVALAGLLMAFGFQMFLLYAFAIVNGAGWTIYMAASRSLLQEIVDEAKYVEGNSFLEVSLQVGMFMAGAASGFVYKYWDFAVILSANAAMFVAGAICVRVIKFQSELAESGREPYLTMMREGFRFLRRNAAILVVGIVSIVPLVVTMIFNVVLPVHVSRSLGRDSVVFGLGDMSYGVGGLLAGLLVAGIAARFDSKKLIVAFFVLATTDLVALSFNSEVMGLYLCCLLLGLANSALRILMNSLIMSRVSKEYMGRAMAVWLGISLVCQCVLSLSVSSYLDRLGAGVGFWVMAVMMGVGGCVFIINGRFMARTAATNG